MSKTSDTALKFQRVEELEPQIAEAVLRWTLSLADTKHRIGMLTSEWINSTPALEAAVGAAAITQDELGHARSYFSMLRDFPGAPEAIGFENDLEAREEYFCPRNLDVPWTSWLDVVAVNVLLDRALRIAVSATGTSTFAPLRQRTAKILQEEEFHAIFGDSWLARLSRAGGKARDELQGSLVRFYGVSRAWLGPAKDPITDRLFEAQILDATSDLMTERWIGQISALLTKYELDVPSAQLDWAEWNPVYRDMSGP